MKNDNDMCPHCGRNINSIESGAPLTPADNPNPLYPPVRAALYLGVCTRTLIKWRVSNCGPVHIKLHTGKGSVRYRKSALDAFIEAGEVNPPETARASTSATARMIGCKEAKQ
jgi:hypothetical protein